MARRLLIVEDNAHKRERIMNFLSETFVGMEIHQAHSFSSGCQKVENVDFDAIIMDMSLPTYDKTSTESGGRFRTFGGREIARKLIRKRGASGLILFLTQYDAFSDRVRSHSLETLDAELREECGGAYAGIIHYNSSKTAWKDAILEKFKAFRDEATDS